MPILDNKPIAVTKCQILICILPYVTTKQENAGRSINMEENVSFVVFLSERCFLILSTWLYWSHNNNKKDMGEGVDVIILFHGCFEDGCYFCLKIHHLC